MSLWKKFAEGLGNLASSVGQGVQSWINSQTGAALTGSQMQQNEFNALEAEKNRVFEERMSSTGFQRQVSDMQSAGVNPALMYGGAGSSGASTPSGSAASGTASVGSLGLGDILSAMRFRKEQSLLQAQIDNVNSQTGVNVTQSALNQAKTNREYSENALTLRKEEYQRIINKYQPDLSKANTEMLVELASKYMEEQDYIYAQKNFVETQNRIAKIEEGKKKDLIESIIKLNNANAGSADADKAYREAMEAWQQFENAYYQENGMAIPSGGIAAVISYLLERAGHLGEFSPKKQLKDFFEAEMSRSSGEGGRGSRNGGGTSEVPASSSRRPGFHYRALPGPLGRFPIKSHKYRNRGGTR